MELGALTAWGPIILGAIIALTQALKWPNWFNYIWAGVAVLWGIAGLM